MSGTAEQSENGLRYQEAQPLAEPVVHTAQTNVEECRFRAVVLTPRGQTRWVHVIPRPPRQRGDEARTD